jgi:hypothetical protein
VKIEIEFKPMEGLGGGFRTDWISAENDELEAGLDSGGGLGNPYLTFWIERKNQKRQYFTADMRPVLQAAVEVAP